MATSTAAVVLSATGGAAELLGLVLVFIEIADNRRRGKELLARLDAPPTPERSYPSPASELYLRQRYALSEPKMRDELPRLQADLQKTMVGLKKLTDAELDRAVKRLQDDVAARNSDLRRSVRHLLAGGALKRTLSAVFLVVGVGLATAGSIVGNLN